MNIILLEKLILRKKTEIAERTQEFTKVNSLFLGIANQMRKSNIHQTC